MASWQNTWQKVKARAIRERGHACEVCSYDLVVECDHIIPKARGGTHSEDNAILLCPNCHHLKNRAWPQFRHTKCPGAPSTRKEVIEGIRGYVKAVRDRAYRTEHPAEDLIDYGGM